LFLLDYCSLVTDLVSTFKELFREEIFGDGGGVIGSVSIAVFLGAMLYKSISYFGR
jgi:hypothetical protein